MNRAKNGYTMKQYAYAARRLAPHDAQSKKDIALAVGYSPNVANSVADHIENTKGFDNAMCALASDTGNILLRLMHKLKHEDIDKMSFETAVDQITKLSNAWNMFTPKQEKQSDDTQNKLRAIVLQRVENQTINNVQGVQSPEIEEATIIEDK